MNKNAKITSVPQGQPSTKTLRNRRRREARKFRNIENRDVALVGDMANLGLGPITTRRGALGNAADPRSRLALRELGKTPGGRQAVLKILHPCMEQSNSVTKIPDGAASTSVVMERRDEFVISANAALVALGPLWNVIVITPPYLCGTTMVITYSSGATPAPGERENAFALLFAGMGSPDRTYPAFLLNTGATSGTVFYVSNLLSLTFTPSIVGGTEASISSYIKSVRRTYCGLTTDLDSSDLYNQGRVVSGQWSPDVAESLNTTTDGTTTDLKTAYPIYEIVPPAMSIPTIVESDEFAREAQAKSGSYMPIRPCMPVWEFSPAQEFRNVISVNAGTALGQSGKTAFDDLFLRGWCIGVEFWDGLSVQSNLRIKRREGLELIPAPNSVFSPFATPALPDDIMAKQVVAEFCRMQPHAFPAEYNDLGLMLTDILGGVTEALGGLGIPIVSPLFNASSRAFKGENLGDVFGGLLSSIFG